jgi:hypothetical protein
MVCLILTGVNGFGFRHVFFTFTGAHCFRQIFLFDTAASRITHTTACGRLDMSVSSNTQQWFVENVFPASYKRSQSNGLCLYYNQTKCQQCTAGKPELTHLISLFLISICQSGIRSRWTRYQCVLAPSMRFRHCMF